ncbi:hypothetical protein [Vulgatibacter incomptus]|uniref:hypothetical protein n=1 Tax=Vulgatibacter incomptus TaxID=1391653 RepID=UPI0006834D8A|nr:hypothetical protein [Vulgatibacter incomptus]
MSKLASKLLASSTRGRAIKRPVVDPVRRAMDRAPLDDEPLTEEDVRSLDEAEAEGGPRLSSAEMRRALGLD